MLKVMCTEGSLNPSKNLTNHATRKHLISKLRDSGVAPTDIMQISGHKNLQSSLITAQCLKTNTGKFPTFCQTQEQQINLIPLQIPILEKNIQSCLTAPIKVNNCPLVCPLLCIIPQLPAVVIAISPPTVQMKAGRLQCQILA